jgi:hypothetical protein
VTRPTYPDGRPIEPQDDLTEYAREYARVPKLLPSDVQQREDAALGAAWRRCEKALPENWRISTVGQNYEGDEWHASAWDRKTGAATTGRGPTPTAALEALAEKLEGLRR